MTICKAVNPTILGCLTEGLNLRADGCNKSRRSPMNSVESLAGSQKSPYIRPDGDREGEIFTQANGRQLIVLVLLSHDM